MNNPSRRCYGDTKKNIPKTESCTFPQICGHIRALHAILFFSAILKFLRDSLWSQTPSESTQQIGRIHEFSATNTHRFLESL